MSTAVVPTAMSDPHMLPTSSTIRRKPQFTYRSPSADDAYKGPTHVPNISRTVAATSTAPVVSSAAAMPTIIPEITKVPLKRHKYPMGPPLPLYHPLGRLALSLPPLDPGTFGLPSPQVRVDDNRRSSGRSRRPAAKARDTEYTPPAPSPSPSVNAAQREPKEIKAPTPRKKRAAGTTGNKRKRKETDDGDATYPAKRTRHPRAAKDNDDDGTNNASESVSATRDETPVDVSEDKVPGRRSTRSRPAAKRRDSTESDGTTSSGSHTAPKSQEKNSMDVEVLGEDKRRTRSRSKEEGEVSEEKSS